MQLRNKLMRRTIIVNVFFMHNADVSVNSSGNTIARTIFKNKE